MLYDDQAARFDERAGVPPEAADAVARALARLAGLAPGDVLLEVGAGTGSLSLALLDLGVRYVGFDRSAAMLEVFRGRLEGRSAELHAVDGDARWPVDDGAVALVFASRAIHHLDPAHVAAETVRVLRPGGVLAVGRVQRPRDSVKAVMRREMRHLLQAGGVAARSAEASAGVVFAALERHGAQRLEPVAAARWTVTHSPAESIAAWEEKAGLAGADVPPEAKARVLARLRELAAERYGDPTAQLPQEEWFEITAARLPAR
ncbi:MAG TPA: methyltransferase domain-containing protein [Longimicrobium sp.]|nr:methyltransferase domain-containing protein [Longimicrobium sp.]